MQITIFGASGKTGRQVVALALKQGYTVNAFVHSKNPLTPHPQLHIIHGDIHDPIAVKKALAGSSIVISTLGSWGSSSKTIVSDGVRVVAPAMEQAGISRLVTLTGSAARWLQDKPSRRADFWRAMFSVIAKGILQDGEEHIRLLEESRLNWTCLRSPAMTRKNSMSYKFTISPTSLFAHIPRKAVAAALLDQVTDETHYKQAITIR